MTVATQPLYRISVKSLANLDGAERDVCYACKDHARYIAQTQGPRWYIRGNPFELLGPAGHGECPDCEYRRDAEQRWDRRNDA